MDLVKRQTHLAGARDTAVRNLRDLTIAIAIAATAGVGLTAWVSAATIPGTTGTTGTSGVTGGAAAGTADQATTSTDQGFAQSRPPGNTQFGSGVAVSGGSH